MKRKRQHELASISSCFLKIDITITSSRELKKRDPGNEIVSSPPSQNGCLEENIESLGSSSAREF